LDLFFFAALSHGVTLNFSPFFLPGTDNIPQILLDTKRSSLSCKPLHSRAIPYNLVQSRSHAPHGNAVWMRRIRFNLVFYWLRLSESRTLAYLLNNHTVILECSYRESSFINSVWYGFPAYAGMTARGT